MSVESAFAPDAAMVLGIASTAMPYARTPEAEAERWLRVLRSHGQVGLVLQALGVGDGPPCQPVGDADRAASAPALADRDAVAQVTEQAIRIATERGARGVATTDVLLAVMSVYGADFDRVLQAQGTDRDELIEWLGAELPRSRSQS